MNQNFNDKIDKGLVGNKLIEEAIKGLQEEATQEMLAHTLTVIRKRMKQKGQLIIAVEPSFGSQQMNISVEKTADGLLWWTAYTGFEEEMKGYKISNLCKEPLKGMSKERISQDDKTCIKLEFL